MSHLISIGEASKITGIPAKTMRFYEDINLYKPAKRLENSYRVYTKEDMDILMLIKEAKSLGLPLKDIKQVVHLCLSQGCISANNFLKTKLPEYLDGINRKIRELQDLQTKLQSFNQSSTKSRNEDCLICSKDC